MTPIAETIHELNQQGILKPAGKDLYLLCLPSEDAEYTPTLPIAFPRTKEKALAIGQIQGINDSLTEKVWNAAMGRGGRDAKDISIRSFAHHLKTASLYESDRSTQNHPTVDRNRGTFNRPQDHEPRLFRLNA